MSKKGKKGMKGMGKLWNKTIFWKDITRFWPLWVIGTILLQISVTLPVLFGIKSVLSNRLLTAGESLQDMRNELVFSMGAVFWPIAIAVASLLVAIYVFGYLFKSRSAYAQHFLPVSRVGLFLSHYVAGVVILIVPYLTAYLSLLVINQGYGLELASDILLCFVETLVMILFFYSLACAVIMLVGNGPMAVVVYGVLNILYEGMLLLLNSICREFCYGFYYDEMYSSDSFFAEMLTPINYFMTRVGVNDYYYQTIVVEESYYRGRVCVSTDIFCEILLFLIPTVILFVFALILYKKRPIETAGNSVAFSWGKWIYRVVFTVCGSLFFTGVLYSITHSEWEGTYSHQENFRSVLLLMIVCTILCYIVSNMILEKTFFVWKTMSYIGMAAIGIVVIIGMFWFKNTDIWYKAPDIKKVSCMQLNISPEDGGINLYEINDKTLIEEFIELEREIIEVGRKEKSFSHEGETVGVIYFGDDNYYYDRTYMMPIEDKTILRKVEDFINDPNNLGRVLFGEQYDSLTPNKIELLEDMDEYEGISLGNAKKEIYQALLQDIEAGNVKVEGEKENPRYYFNIRWSGEIIGGGEIVMKEVIVPITDKCTNTVKVMKELKLEYY